MGGMNSIASLNKVGVDFCPPMTGNLPMDMTTRSAS